MRSLYSTLAALVLATAEAEQVGTLVDFAGLSRLRLTNWPY